MGMLFLAGGGFYFFATNLMQSDNSSNNGSNSNGNASPQLTLSPTYPSSVRTKATFTMSFTMTNPTEYTAHSITSKREREKRKNRNAGKANNHSTGSS